MWEQGVLDVCLYLGCGSVGGVGGEWVVGLEQGLEWWGGVLCVYGSYMYLYSVIVGYLRILGAPSVQSCCTLWISASYIPVFVYGRYCKYRLVCVWLLNLDLSRHHPLNYHFHTDQNGNTKSGCT